MASRKKRLLLIKKTKPFTVRGDGEIIHPGDGVVPVLKEVGWKRLSVVGTGFYVTRYGLFITAGHVLEELKSSDGTTMVSSFVCHLHENDKILLRPILKGHSLNDVDIGIAQADNYMGTYPENPLMNLRGRLSTQFPREGEPLTTYAYPENEVLNFSRDDHIREIFGDYFQGGYMRFVQESQHPFLRFSYFETSLELRSGTSGGPVFDSRGRIVGINCRGWDFRGSEHEFSPLSYIVPIEYIMNVDVDPFMVPPHSWEAKQIPEERRGHPLKGYELTKYGHFLFDPPLS
jgi:hypothetical protein